MANDTSALDAFLATLGHLAVQPKAKDTKKSKDNAPTLEDKGATSLAVEAYQAAEEAAQNFKTGIAKYQAGILTKNGLANIFQEYTDAQDSLSKLDLPGASAIQAQYFGKPPAQNNASGVVPAIVYDANGNPEKNPDGSYKTSTATDAQGGYVNTQPEARYDKYGNSLIPGTAAYAAGSTKMPSPAGSNSGSEKGNASKTSTTPSPAAPVDINAPVTEGTPLQGAAGYNMDAKAQVADQQKWAQQYGGIGAMALTIPWMKNILANAAAGHWDATKFTNAIKGYKDENGQSPWDAMSQAYKDSSISYFDNKDAWAQQYNDKLKILQQSAVAQGLDPSIFGQPIPVGADGKTMDPKAIDAAYNDQHSGVNSFFNVYYNNMPDQGAVDKYVAAHSTLAKTDNGVYAGVIGQNIDALKSYANDMGIASQYLPSKQGSSGDYFANAALAIQQGGSTLETEQGYLRDQAASMYAPFAQRIKEGQTVRSLASPYLNAAANLLEVDPSTIDLGSATGLGASVTKALQGDSKTPMALDQFVTSVKQRPEWLQTSNARNSLMDTANTLLRNFGMVTGG